MVRPNQKLLFSALLAVIITALVVLTALLLRPSDQPLAQLASHTGGVDAPNESLEEDLAGGLLYVVPQHQKVMVPVQGPVRAEDRLALIPEVQGELLRGDHPLREGTRFARNEVIYRVDDTELRLQLYAARSGFQRLVASLLPDIKLDYPGEFAQFSDWFNRLHPEQTIPPVPDTGNARLNQFLSARGLSDHYYQIESLQARLQKFTVKAPFDGHLSRVGAEVGQRVGPQQNIATIIGKETLIWTISVDAGLAAHTLPGDTVWMQSASLTNPISVQIDRINPSVDHASQNVTMYLRVISSELRDGQYAEGILQTNHHLLLTRIPRTALSRNGNVYARIDDVLQPIPVRIHNLDGSNVWVAGIQAPVYIAQDAGSAFAGQIVAEARP